MITAATPIPAGDQVVDIPLSYNPITVEIDLAALQNTAPGTMSGILTGDRSTNQNDASSNYGLSVSLLSGFSTALGALTEALGKLGIAIPTVTLNVLTD
ncbi:hypothetical protein [Flexivirga sp. B27]